jgi:hypothetical protein
MGTILGNAHIRAELADRSSRRASQLDWPVVVDRYLSIYEKLIETPGTPIRLKAELKKP